MKFDVKQDVTQRLSAKPDPSINNLVLLKLNKVTIDKKVQEVDPDKAVEMQSEYAGMEVPRIFFEFQQVFMPNTPLAKEGVDRFYVYNEGPIVTFKNAENPGDERKKIDAKALENIYLELWKHLKHIHDAFIGTPNYIPIESVPEIKEDAKPETRIKQFEAFFEMFANAFNNGKGDKPIYEDGNGKPITLVSKLVVNRKEKRRNFPFFTGKGFIERAKIQDGKVITSLEIYNNETTDIPSGSNEGNANSTATSGDLPPTGGQNVADFIQGLNQ
jgi:hypothetical protein